MGLKEIGYNSQGPHFLDVLKDNFQIMLSPLEKLMKIFTLTEFPNFNGVFFP